MNMLGMHDRQGRHIVPVSGWCLDTVALSENPGAQNYAALRSDINWLVRLNWGYGSTGTFPLPGQHNRYVDAALKYAVQSNNAFGFILGNEPNHEQERPEGTLLTPRYVANIFVDTRNAIKSVNSSIRVMPPPIAPYHASPMDWLFYLEEMYREIYRLGGEVDGVPIHAYTRSSSPEDISGNAKMGAPLVGQFSGFRTYKDALAVTAAFAKKTPAFITEFNELREDGWEDVNNGVFKAAIRELREHNKTTSGSQVYSLIAYRWPDFDKWQIEKKGNVIQDFLSAIVDAEMGDVRTPVNTYAPVVATPPPVVATRPVQFKREIEQDALNYGVGVVPFKEDGLKNGDFVWVAERVERLHEKEGEGRHHFYFETVDEQGNRLAGYSIKVKWPSGEFVVYSEAKPGEPWSANYPFSPGRNSFSAFVMNDKASDLVTGAGMGEDYPEGFNVNVHASITVRFVRRRYTKQAIPAMPPLQETPKPAMPLPKTSAEMDKVPILVHPILDSSVRRITQVFGVNGDYYKRFKVDGVPLNGHNGVDFGTPIGTAIVAIAPGRVVEVASDPSGYGNYVKISHPWGESLYAHLNSSIVRVGDTVYAGQLIASSGNTGNSTGPHLHFGLRVAPFNRADGWGGYIDPLPYLDVVHKPPNPAKDAQGIVQIIKQVASETAMEWQFLASFAWAESSFRPTIVSNKSAGGLMQISEDTWREWAPKVGATDINNPLDNLRVGAAYYNFLLKYYQGDRKLAIYAYNFGSGRVDRGDTIPLETIIFYHKIVHGTDLLKAIGDTQ